MSNVAAAYRIIRRYAYAARWDKRAAAAGDGDAMTDWGYCLHYGMGVKRDSTEAQRVYRCAIRSTWITEWSREESMYHLAVLLLSKRPGTSRQLAIRLLRRANTDGDYPAAATVLGQVEAGELAPYCGCRRNLRPGLARAGCPLHGRGPLQRGKA